MNSLLLIMTFPSFLLFNVKRLSIENWTNNSKLWVFMYILMSTAKSHAARTNRTCIIRALFVAHEILQAHSSRFGKIGMDWFRGPWSDHIRLKISGFYGNSYIFLRILLFYKMINWQISLYPSWERNFQELAGQNVENV